MSSPHWNSIKEVPREALLPSTVQSDIAREHVLPAPNQELPAVLATFPTRLTLLSVHSPPSPTCIPPPKQALLSEMRELRTATVVL
jgi:hypothetical protein